MATRSGDQMTANDAYDAALSTAFRPGDGPSQLPKVARFRVRLHPYAIAVVTGFPGLVGGGMVAAALSRTGTSDGAFPPGAVLLVVAATLLLLGLASYLAIDEHGVTVRFYGIRATRVNFEGLVAATFGMAFPSISFNVALKDGGGRIARIHANWWQREREIMAVVLRELLHRDVAMDRQTAGIVARSLNVKAPRARIVHRALFNRDKTW